MDFRLAVSGDRLQAHPYRYLGDAALMGEGIAAVTSRGPSWCLSTAPMRGLLCAHFPAQPPDETVW